MGQQEKPRDQESQAMQVVGGGAGVLVLAGLFWMTVLAGLVWLTVYAWRLPTPRDPYYMVSITGVDGLNQEATTSGGVPTTTLSPVFNLTVRIDSSGYAWYRACVGELSSAVVSYGDAFLGKGSVPPFCAGEARGAAVQEREATAWGEDVVLPRFLRERLSAELERGEASLDVQVTMPAGGDYAGGLFPVHRQGACLQQGQDRRGFFSVPREASLCAVCASRRTINQLNMEDLLRSSYWVQFVVQVCAVLHCYRASTGVPKKILPKHWISKLPKTY
ncbi:unnamed protein product [Miscanthus lutarioriparius]|uniref:Late embryogenesis abundant protein LEA-2 subgroup domain-containing protein n=1 Tax=Miscanthus lutarioriparius TaxID=422564 RepID=A0A811QPV7_9POAL|nr:unnamed protein product [Miscanthus lutarioriparius]